MILGVNATLTGGISRKIRDSIIAFQYADDTAVIAKADLTSLISLKLIIRLFASISGLKVNFEKSIFVPLNVGQADMPWVQAVIGCTRSDFPVQYLGLPLTLKSPTRNLFMPLIEKFEKKLSGWKGKLISKGGRLQLVQSVLSAIPVYHMMCFRLPQWIIQRIDKIRRMFLWGSSSDNKRPFSLINWALACRPRKWGGLGISNLTITNISLLLRWWWKLYTEPNGLWSVVVYRIHRRQLGDSQVKIWLKEGSFFWYQLQKLTALFTWSTSWKIGDGATISFWMDPWAGQPRIHLAEGDITRPYISLSEAWPDRQGLDPSLDNTVQVEFNAETDQIKWNWSNIGCYSANSICRVLGGGGLIQWQFSFFWKSKIPPHSQNFCLFTVAG